MSVATIGKIKFPCCASRPSPDTEDNVYTKMKINKINKVKVINQSINNEEVLPKNNM